MDKTAYRANIDQKWRSATAKQFHPNKKKRVLKNSKFKKEIHHKCFGRIFNFRFWTIPNTSLENNQLICVGVEVMTEYMQVYKKKLFGINIVLRLNQEGKKKGKGTSSFSNSRVGNSNQLL